MQKEDNSKDDFQKLDTTFLFRIHICKSMNLVRRQKCKTEAPTRVEQKQLDELAIAIVETEE